MALAAPIALADGPRRGADGRPCPDPPPALETESFVRKVFRILARNSQERPKIVSKQAAVPTSTPSPTYHDGLTRVWFEKLSESPSYPIDPPGLRRGMVTLRAHLLKQIDRNFSKKGGVNWITYQSRWDISQACHALRGKKLADSRPIAPITSRLSDRTPLEFAIGCEPSNDQEMDDDPTTPAEYYCVTDQDISFNCEVTWSE